MTRSLPTSQKGEAHTPGPWEIAPQSPPSSPAEWRWIGPTDWRTRVARVVIYAGEEAEQEANARLIAAAPDGFALAKRVAVREIEGRFYVTVFGDDGGFWSAPLPDDMVAPAREFEAARSAYLAKASPQGGEG